MSLIQDTSETEERRDVSNYINGLIPREEFIGKYPKYTSLIQALEEKNERAIGRQDAFMSSIKGGLKNKYLQSILKLLISNQALILNLPFFNLLPAGYSLVSLVPIDDFCYKLKLSKNTKLALKFFLMLITTNYMYAFKSAIDVSKTSIPNLISISRGLTDDIMKIVAKGGLLQLNNLMGLGSYQKAILSGKLLKELQKLSTHVIGNSLAAALVQSTIINTELDVKEIINSVDDGEGFKGMVKGMYNKIMGNVKDMKSIEEQIFKSPTTLYTNEQTKRLNNNMLKLEPIMLDLALIQEVSDTKLSLITNPSLLLKSAEIIKSIPTSLEDIKNQKYGSQFESVIMESLTYLDPELTKHININTLNINAKEINNKIDITCDYLSSEASYAFYKGVEQYNYQTTAGGFLNLPGIKIAEVNPSNLQNKVQEINIDIMLGGLSLIYLFTLFYWVYFGAKKIYKHFKPSNDNSVSVEVLEQRIRNKKNRSRRNY